MNHISEIKFNKEDKFDKLMEKIKDLLPDKFKEGISYAHMKTAIKANFALLCIGMEIATNLSEIRSNLMNNRDSTVYTEKLHMVYAKYMLMFIADDSIFAEIYTDDYRKYFLYTIIRDSLPIDSNFITKDGLDELVKLINTHNELIYSINNKSSDDMLHVHEYFKIIDDILDILYAGLTMDKKNY